MRRRDRTKDDDQRLPHRIMSKSATVNQCVKCGLCLPHCPTFKLNGTETESPRGRIALIQTLENNPADVSPGLINHLDTCLGCLACEAMCPSKVPFGALMDGARSELETVRRRSFIHRVLRRTGLSLITAGPTKKGFLVAILRLYRLSGMQRLLRKAHLLRGNLQRLDRLLVRTPRRFKSAQVTGNQSEAKPTVQLFTGCISSLIDSDALDAAQILLNKTGYTVVVNQDQVCCGALHQHLGELQTARSLALQNCPLYSTCPEQILVTIASGCAAQLRAYPSLYEGSIPAEFAQQVVDIHQLLIDSEQFPQLNFEPLNETVAVHIPCTQGNVLHDSDSPFKLLERIPGLQLQTMESSMGCCGAAGSYCLTQPEQSDQLGRKTLVCLAAAPPGYLVTSNTGCALHMAALIEASGWDTEVLHPVTLLARQLASS